MEKVNIGAVGLGGRGHNVLTELLIQMEDVVCTYVCDSYEDRALRAQKDVARIAGNTPKATTDWRELVSSPDVDAVIIMSAWESHIPIAVGAMEAGKPVATEVGGAYEVEDCWNLVRTSERTGVQCMFLENCCYGRYEMMILNMVRQGVFGDVVHCAGGYHHDLRSEILFGRENRHYRFRNYVNRDCDNYPSHELGPIAKILNINRGNRMMTLTSMSSCSKGLKEYIRTREKADKSLLDVNFRQGDIVTTSIKCANGETIVLTLDTNLPRAYSRGFTVRGTKALYQEDNNSIFIDQQDEAYEFNGNGLWNNADKYFEKYEHPLWKSYLEGGIKGGHGGMDGLVYDSFIQAVKNDTIVPIDVYDAAAWMAITALSEQSISLGSAPVAIPDFTSGRWYNRESKCESVYSLE